MSNLTCVLPVEIKSRDLDPKILLGVEFASKGFKVVIGAKSFINRNLGSFKPFVYFDKGLTPNVKFYENIHNNGGCVVVLDEEGGVFENSMFTFLIRYPEHILPYVDLIFCWGQKTRDCLLNNRNSVVANKICVTGHPRFDLKQKKYGSLFEKEASRIKAKYKDFILVNTSFAYANHFVGYDVIKSSAGYFGKEDPLKEGVDYAYYRLLIYYFIKAIKRISREHPNINIVLRTHPSESSELYVKYLEGHDNVHVIYDGNVQDWIVASRLVIHHDCTTGIESVLSGKPTISYTPIRDNDFAPSLPMDVSDVVSTEDELMNTIVNYLNSGTEYSGSAIVRDNAVFNQWLANIDASSCACIVEIINKHELVFLDKCNERIKKTGTSMLSRLRNKITDCRAMIEPNSYMKHKGVCNFDLQDMRNKIDLFTVIGAYPKCNVCMISRDCVCIDKA